MKMSDCNQQAKFSDMFNQMTVCVSAMLCVCDFTCPVCSYTGCICNKCVHLCVKVFVYH